MGQWHIETRAYQQILIHHCDKARSGENSDPMHQDIGGGYVRCDRCGEKYLPAAEPGHQRLLLRLRPTIEVHQEIPEPV
jgi:hypothetical protein